MEKPLETPEIIAQVKGEPFTPITRALCALALKFGAEIHLTKAESPTAARHSIGHVAGRL